MLSGQRDANRILGLVGSDSVLCNMANTGVIPVKQSEGLRTASVYTMAITRRGTRVNMAGLSQQRYQAVRG